MKISTLAVVLSVSLGVLSDSSNELGGSSEDSDIYVGNLVKRAPGIPRAPGDFIPEGSKVDKTEDKKPAAAPKQKSQPQGIPKAPGDFVPGGDSLLAPKAEPQGIKKAPSDVINNAPMGEAKAAQGKAEPIKKAPSDKIEQAPAKAQAKGEPIKKAPSDVINNAPAGEAKAQAKAEPIKKAPSDRIELEPASGAQKGAAAKQDLTSAESIEKTSDQQSAEGFKKAPSDTQGAADTQAESKQLKKAPSKENSVDEETAPGLEAGFQAAPGQSKAKEPESKKEPAAKEVSKQATSEEDESTGKPVLADVQLPPSLNIENFDDVVSERLSFVEFFSPYCSHCKTLAPIWEQTYKEFHKEMKNLNVQMVQVNCVENGDLCEREVIQYYPNLRLYTPKRDPDSKQIIKGSHNNVGTFPRSIVKTPENFKKYLKNSVAEYNDGSIDMPSSSELLTTDSMLRIAAGEFTEPIFVIFFPQSDEGWKHNEETNKNTFISRCVDCTDFKQLWGKLSNQILSTVKTGHFNCMSNEDLCTKLGLKKLTHYDSTWNVQPKLVMFLPKQTGIIKLDYEGDVNIESIKKWTAKLRENYRFEKIKNRALQEILEVKNSLPLQPLNTYYPLENKMALVLIHEDNLFTDEDRGILPYILEYVTKLPFNINIYTSSDLKLDNYIGSQSNSIIEFVNYDQEAPQYEYNLPMHMATTLTSKPTLYFFKENSLITPIYQNFAIEDMRNEVKIKEFIEMNQFPLYQELTPELLSTYFPRRFGDKKTKDLISKGIDDKVVVAFIDSNDASQTNSALYNISLIAHEYHVLKNEYYFADILSKRQDKKELVEKLSKQDASSGDIITAMRNEIPHLFSENEVLFTFIDTANNPELARKLGWDTTSVNYTVGDTIIVSRNGKYYWNKDISGQAQLKNDPSSIKKVLQYLLDPKLVTNTNVRVNSLLIGSPYNNWLRLMDHVHQYGFLGYCAFFISIYMAYVFLRKLRRRRSVRLPKSETGQGLLGKRD